MKFAALLTTLLVVATVMASPASPDISKCREHLAERHEGLSVIELLEMDLLQGKWTAQAEGHTQLTYLFSENGILHQFTESENGTTAYATCFWEIITAEEGRSVLKMTNSQHREIRKAIKQTCEGMALTDLDEGHVLCFGFQPLDAPKKMNSTAAALLGEWTNVTVLQTEKRSLKTQGAYLGYSFLSDGQFQFEYGNTKSHITEKGQWEVSKDGQFLLLYVYESNQPDQVGGVKVVKINQLDDHGLILEEVMKESSAREFFETENTVFTFIR